MSEETTIQPGTSGVSAREAELIQELIKERMAQNQKLEYEDFDGYELPPRTQFSMLKKPAVSIKWGRLTFNMAAIRLFQGIQHILPMVHTKKKRFTIIPVEEEESASIEWARLNKEEQLVNKDITSVDFLESIFKIMDWKRECRYKVLGTVKNSERGLVLVFELEEAIMFAPQKEEYIDHSTGEVKKRQVKYYPDAYKDKIGRSYNDYVAGQQMSIFEDIATYETADEQFAASGSVTENKP